MKTILAVLALPTFLLAFIRKEGLNFSKLKVVLTELLNLVDGKHSTYGPNVVDGGKGAISVTGPVSLPTLKAIKGKCIHHISIDSPKANESFFDNPENFRFLEVVVLRNGNACNFLCSLAQLMSVKRLQIIQKEPLKNVHSLPPSLEELAIIKCNNLQELPDLPALTYLRLEDCIISKSLFRDLSAPRLASLTLKGEGIDDGSITNLNHFPSLKHLALESLGFEIVERHCQVFSQILTLEKLCLHNCRIEANAITLLQTLTFAVQVSGEL